MRALVLWARRLTTPILLAVVPSMFSWSTACCRYFAKHPEKAFTCIPANFLILHLKLVIIFFLVKIIRLKKIVPMNTEKSMYFFSLSLDN